MALRMRNVPFSISTHEWRSRPFGILYSSIQNAIDNTAILDRRAKYLHARLSNHPNPSQTLCSESNMLLHVLHLHRSPSRVAFMINHGHQSKACESSRSHLPLLMNKRSQVVGSLLMCLARYIFGKRVFIPVDAKFLVRGGGDDVEER